MLFYKLLFGTSVLNTDVFQRVGIEVSSFQGVKEKRSSTVYRGVLISGGWNRGVPHRNVLISDG